MNRLGVLYRSTVGKKAIVAATGAILLAFLVFHSIGNLKAFLPDVAGVPDIDVYAAFLRSMGEPLLPHGVILWVVRIVLLASLVLHVVCVLQLEAHNRRARPVQYARTETVEATVSGRSMLYTGAILLLFVAVHIPHLTLGTLDAARFEHGAVFENLMRAFEQERFVGLYVAVALVLGVHVYHGAWSAFQTLGFDNPDRNRGLRRLALLIAVALPLAFAAVPIAFFTGAMDPPPTQTARSGGGH